MKIMIISDPGTVGGATRSLVDVSTELKRSGDDILVCTSSFNELNKELCEREIDSFACGHKSAMNPKSPFLWKRPIKYPIELIQYKIAERTAIHKIEDNIDLKTIDIIHTNSARNDIGCILKQKHGIPHVMHIREFGTEDFDCCIYRKNYYNFLNKNTDVFIAISQAVAKSWIKRGLEASKVRVIYNGIDFHEVSAPDFNHNNKTLKMVIVGGICEAKGQLQIVRALSKISADILKNIELSIIGWGDPRYKDEILEYVNQHDLARNVNILEASNNVHEMLPKYDIGLMCSRSEGFGRVTAEYMFAGLGVIASDTGANPELIDNGVNGLIYRYGDEDDLAQAIMKLYVDRECLNLYAKHAYDDAHARFTIKNNVENIKRIYSEIEESLILD